MKTVYRTVIRSDGYDIEQWNPDQQDWEWIDSYNSLDEIPPEYLGNPKHSYILGRSA